MLVLMIILIILITRASYNLFLSLNSCELPSLCRFSFSVLRGTNLFESVHLRTAKMFSLLIVRVQANKITVFEFEICNRF